MGSEVAAEMIEDFFGKHSDSIRFANFCNSIVLAQSSAWPSTVPILSEKPGADGGMDGEWTIPSDSASEFKSPFGSKGWNIFQYKARSIAGSTRNQEISKLCNDVTGALEKLTNRLAEPKKCQQYSLFTNLQLGLETVAKTSDHKILQKQRAKLKAAIAKSNDADTLIEVFDAAQLAAIVNSHPALRLTYFSGPVARSWIDTWQAEHRIKDYKVTVPFIGRSQELNRVENWLKDTTTKVFVLCGSSGMGKSRLALEATRQFALATTVVEVVDELLHWDFRAFGLSAATRIIIVEDPTRDQAEALAKRAVACEGVKLILTLPTDSKAPAPKFTDHESIKVLPPLQPLNNAEAENLLKTAGASFDRQALDWILLQAGGNPEILLSTAELKNDLREKSGDLKRRLYERFRAKIEKELGLDGIRTLKVLSTLLSVKHQGENSELKLVCGTLDLGIQPPRILELLPDLERMGYIRRRGNYVSVIPPMFAARLVEEIAAAQESSIQSLFNALGEAGRGRFLERMVTVDLPQASAFWDFIFGNNGPLEHDSQTAIHFAHIESLARAVPGRTGRFLESKLNDETSSAWKGHYCLSTLRELAYEAESCASGIRCLELLAVREVEETGQVKETKLFCECFVDWYHDFPMSYQERRAWIERLVQSEKRPLRLLGAHIVSFVTKPPHSLSGYAGGVARKLGQPPPRRMWKEVFDYMEGLVELRLNLTQSEDEEIAKIARTDFESSLSALKRHVSPDQHASIIERTVEWNLNGELPLDVRKVRAAIHWVEARYTERSQAPDQEEFTDKWAAVLKRIANVRNRYDGGDFLLRLKICTGHSDDYTWEPGEEGRVYGYQKRLRRLAAETANDPALMTDDAWNVLEDSNAHHASEFIQFLGECDIRKQFRAHFESQIHDDAGIWRFGLYCLGLSRSDPGYVESYLDSLANLSTMGKRSLLSPIKLIGATPANRKRLLQFIAERSVAPIDIAAMFTTGRWLEELPISEVVTIFDFIAEGEKWSEWAASVMNLYLHPNKALPKELIPIGERILQEIEETYNNAHYCNDIALGIAKRDLENGFSLLEKQIIVLNKMDIHQWRNVWNPFRRHGGGEFWDYLRTENPERGYRSFCALKNRLILRNEIFEDNRTLLDLENHSPILLKIAHENESDAQQIARAISIKQPRFFPFAFELLSGRPIDGKTAGCLMSALVERFGFGTELEKQRKALRDIEAQLNNPNLPSQGRVWLERAKAYIQEQVSSSPWNTGDNEPLGWS